MSRIALLAAAVTVTAALTAPAAGGAQDSERQCFWANQVSGFSDAGPKRALLRIGNKETWELTLSPGCPDVNWAMSIGIRSRGSERICSGSDAELLVPNASGSGTQRCFLRSVRKLPGEGPAAAPEEKRTP